VNFDLKVAVLIFSLRAESTDSPKPTGRKGDNVVGDPIMYINFVCAFKKAIAKSL